MTKSLMIRSLILPQHLIPPSLFTDNGEDGEYTSAYFTVNPVALLSLTDNRLKQNHWITNFAAEYRFHFLPQMRIALNIAADDLDRSFTRLLTLLHHWAGTVMA